MTGIHHVTAISGKAERNLDFYWHVMGLPGQKDREF